MQFLRLASSFSMGMISAVALIGGRLRAEGLSYLAGIFVCIILIWWSFRMEPKPK